MRIISWNVNGIRANVKKGAFDWLLQESPDIFCLQETKAQPDQLEESTRNPDGYHSYFDHSKGRKGYSGVAIFTKVEPEKVEYSIGVPELDQEGRFIAAFFEDFVLATVYFPNGGSGADRLDYKLRFYDAFLKYINKVRKTGKEIIFCGDVNTAHTEIDLARPKENSENTGFLPIERKWIDKVIANRYVDIFRYLYPNAKEKYTYWDMKTFARERNVGWRIDYFFISDGLLAAQPKAKIHSTVVGSDHCPIELDIKIDSYN